MNITLKAAIRKARRIAPLSHSAAARVLIAAGVPFRQSVHFALHCARSVRGVK